MRPPPVPRGYAAGAPRVRSNFSLTRLSHCWQFAPVWLPLIHAVPVHVPVPVPIPVDGDNTRAGVKLARHATNLVQFEEKPADILVHRFDLRKLRKHAGYPFLKLASGLGQLLDALRETDILMPLETSNCRIKAVPHIRQRREKADDSGSLFVQRGDATLKKHELFLKLQQAVHGLFDLCASRTRACLQLGELCARTEQNQTRHSVL